MREAGGCSELEMPGKSAFSDIKVHVGAKESQVAQSVSETWGRP